MTIKEVAGIVIIIAIGLMCLPGCATPLKLHNMQDEIGTLAVSQGKTLQECRKRTEFCLDNLSDAEGRILALEAKLESMNARFDSLYDTVLSLQRFRAKHAERWPTLEQYYGE